MPQLRPLPEGARVVHVGPPKTGSTALQDALHQARVSLTDQGATYVSRTRHELIPAKYVTGQLPTNPKWAWAEQRWHELVDGMRAEGPERKLYSSEYLADASEEQVVRLVDAFGPEEIHVVVTLRPLLSIVPSQYQQDLQSGSTADYESWLRSVFVDDPVGGEASAFWQRHRHDALVERWARIAGRDRVTVVAHDGRDFTTVPAAFERLLGLLPGTLVGREVRSNRSLTWPEAEVMRRFNIEARRLGLVDSKYETLTRYAADRVKQRVPDAAEQRIVTPVWAEECARELGAAFAGGIASSGVRVLGDLDALVPPPSVTRLRPRPPGAVDLDVAALFAAAFVEGERRLRSEVAARQAARDAAAAPPQPGTEKPRLPKQRRRSA